MEDEAFRVLQRMTPLTRDGFEHSEPMHAANLRWSLEAGRATLSLTPPWDGMRRTRWPDLPSPLLVLEPDDVVRIDWNGRFRASLAGSDRSFFYDQHTYWLALTEAPRRDLFTAAKPRKHLDLRTRIY